MMNLVSDSGQVLSNPFRAVTSFCLVVDVFAHTLTSFAIILLTAFYISSGFSCNALYVVAHL